MHMTNCYPEVARSAERSKDQRNPELCGVGLALPIRDGLAGFSR
jgi:hypothetical protein